jgi:hypothetical protein
MSTPPDFAVGQVLTAAAMDSVAMWLVKTQTIGNTVGSVTVTGAFSADYDNYKVLLVGGAGSTNAGLAVTIGSANTGYYCVRRTSTYAAPTTDNGGADNNGSQFTGVGFTSTSGSYLDLHIYAPFLTALTFINGYRIVNSAAGTVMGYLDDTTSHSSFTITASGGATMTGGTIRVYGYRN